MTRDEKRVVMIMSTLCLHPEIFDYCGLAELIEDLIKVFKTLDKSGGS